MLAEAYMLFYLKATPNYPSASKQQVKTASPLLTSQTAASTGPRNVVDGQQFIPTGQKSPVSSTTPNETTRTSFVPQGSKIPPANQCERVSFGIKPAHQQHQQQQLPGSGSQLQIVMHIKSSKVVSLSPTKKNKSAEGNLTSPSKLVPYGDKSDSEEDVGVSVKSAKKTEYLKQKGTEDHEQEVAKKSSRVTTPAMKSKEIHTKY